jgi:hypothetical protein
MDLIFAAVFQQPLSTRVKYVGTSDLLRGGENVLIPVTIV